MYFTQTTANVINLIDYQTNAIKTWTVPTPLAGPLGLYVTPDGAVWFCEMLANKIGRLNATDGTFKEYPLPLSLATPSVMRAATEGGRYLWFTAIATVCLSLPFAFHYV
jgi:streptogramin lyase